jgi:glycosyltransferase involved in cell wall biosynthesis
MNRISVIIPCYNEEASVADVIRAVPADVFEIIVVDNNSHDRTAEIARNAGARVVQETRQGYGAALKAGFRAAQGEIIATLDGDGQYPAEKIFEIASDLDRERLDFISANRFPLDNPRSLARTRVVGNMLFTFATNILFGLRLRDSQSGMWIFRRKVLESIWPTSDGMPLSQELKIRAATARNIRFGEYHIPYRLRSGHSKLIPWKHGLINLASLLWLRGTLWRAEVRRMFQRESTRSIS